jgi:hypothetical protein
MFEAMDAIRGTPDGPSVHLLGFMQGVNYKVPENWQGHKVLVE